MSVSVSVSAPMPDDRSFHVIEAVPDRLEGAPQRGRRNWSEAFKTQLIAETLAPGANVSAIARREGTASATNLFNTDQGRDDAPCLARAGAEQGRDIG